MDRPGFGCLALVGMVFSLAATTSAATNVAVFNFQMKSDTPDWRWLEKGLSDRIATDFVQSRSLSVIARDEMEVMAEKMRWVPEMATSDPARMEELKKQLKIEYLVTGVYSVANGQITITGQIVEVEGRKEVARKEISGKADDVLDLQRRLSAEPTAPSAPKAEPVLAPKAPPAPPPPPKDPVAENERKSQNALQLGEIYESKGMTDAARKAYARVIEQFPGTPAAAAAKKKLEALPQGEQTGKP